MDDSDLIQAAKHGDIESFNRLVMLYQDLAYTVAFRIMGDSASAADATQEAFISAYRKIHQFRGESFKPWLMRIITNACYDELRRRQRRPASSLEALHEVASEESWHPSNPAENPEQHAQRSELNAAIQDCISGLPDDQRIIVIMSDVEAYSYQEIGSITDLPLGTIKSRLSRARQRLRDCLQTVQELLPAEYRLMNE